MYSEPTLSRNKQINRLKLKINHQKLILNQKLARKNFKREKETRKEGKKDKKLKIDRKGKNKHQINDKLK